MPMIILNQVFYPISEKENKFKLIFRANVKCPGLFQFNKPHFTSAKVQFNPGQFSSSQLISAKVQFSLLQQA